MNGHTVAAEAKVVADPRATKLPRNENKLKLSRYNENAPRALPISAASISAETSIILGEYRIIVMHN